VPKQGMALFFSTAYTTKAAKWQKG
jgi:hypothetical protein